MHHVTVDLLREAYYALKRNAAPGADGVTWKEYGDNLEARLADLHDRLQSGRYRAQPSKRRWIPKPDGRLRPLGIACLEDKIAQQALVMVLNEIYEEDFLGFTHICAKQRSDGGLTILRKTIGKRLRQKVHEVRQTLLRCRHRPVAEQGRWLRSVVVGFFGYHAVPGNGRALKTFRTEINRAWLRALRRRSQKGQKLNWARMRRLIATWIPAAKVRHPYPNQRLTVRPKVGAV